MEDKDIKEGLRVKSRWGIGTVIAKLAKGYPKYLVEWDTWRNGHDGERTESELEWGKVSTFNDNRYYFMDAQELKLIEPRLNYNYLIL